MYLSHMFLQTNGEQLEEKYNAVKSISTLSREGVYVFIYTDMEKLLNKEKLTRHQRKQNG
jgi:hypothetical protein